MKFRNVQRDLHKAATLPPTCPAAEIGGHFSSTAAGSFVVPCCRSKCLEASLSSEEARSGRTSPCQQPQAPTPRHACTHLF